MDIETLDLSEPKIVWPAGAVLGEGPVWDESRHTLYWLDIKGQKIHSLAPQTDTRESWTSDEPVGCIQTPNSQGECLAATRSGFARLTLNQAGTDNRHALVSPEVEALPGNRFNDGKTAPDGSFWAGTMDDAEVHDSGAWWRFDPERGEAQRLETGYRVTNGPAFDARLERVYLTDSARQTIFVADWIAGGGFKNKRVFLQFAEADGYPDGMQVYRDGSLWVAFWDAACLRRFAPDGTRLQTIALPMQRPTNLAFAPEIRSLFVTSASIGLSADGVQGGLAQLNWA